MRWTHAWLAIGVGTLAVGCQIPVGTGLEVARYATRNLLEAPVDARDDCLERARNRHLAAEAWETVRHEHEGQAYSVHYADGFQDGFADFLYAGGTGDPPVVPPWRYRRLTYETPEGNAAIEDWFAGFRHGAATARDSGLRNLVVVPASMPGVVSTQSSAPLDAPGHATGFATESLPPPRVMPVPAPAEKVVPPQIP